MTSFQRAIAYKVSIAQLKKGRFHKSDGEYDPNYVMVGSKKVSRANVVATIISVEKNTFTLDDGTDEILSRDFVQAFNGMEKGDLVLCIGKIREDDERFLNVEIAKKLLDPDYASLRQAELKKLESQIEVEETVNEITEAPSKDDGLTLEIENMGID